MTKKFTARKVLQAMRQVKGERRVVYKCSQCGTFFGRRFIPYAIGRGIAVNECICQLTSRNVASTTVLGPMY